MLPFRFALGQLAALTVQGVTHNYGIDAVPDLLSRAQLPALLVLPQGVPERRLVPDTGAGLSAVAFAEGTRTVVYTVTHLLLVRPATSGSGLRGYLPPLVDLIDAYFDALSSDVTLNGALRQPPGVRVEPGTFGHGDTVYIGCAFRHTWEIEL